MYIYFCFNPFSVRSRFYDSMRMYMYVYVYEKKEEIWLNPVTKTHTPTE